MDLIDLAFNGTKTCAALATAVVVQDAEKRGLALGLTSCSPDEIVDEMIRMGHAHESLKACMSGRRDHLRRMVGIEIKKEYERRLRHE